jgi:hypothetical protein
MPTFTPVQLLQSLLLIQSLLLAAFLWRRRALWPLALFLALLGMHMGWNLVLAQGIGIVDLRAGFALAYGPLILALVRHLAWRERPRLSPLHALAPLLAPVLLSLWPDAQTTIWPLVVFSVVAYLIAAFR